MSRILWAAEYHLTCCFPAVPVALELRRRGHEIVILSVPESRATFEDLGFGFRANRRFPAYDFSRRETTPITPEEEFSSEKFWKWWRHRVRDQFTDVDELLRSEHYDLLFSKSCLMLCGSGFAAERAGVPWVSYIHFCFDETEPTPLGLPDAWNRLRARMGLGPEPRPQSEVYWYAYSPWLVLLLGIPQLQHRRSTLPPYVAEVGPTAWDPPYTGKRPSWLNGLGRDRPAVLISVSNFWQEDHDLVALTAKALADEDVDVVATVPSDHDLSAVAAGVQLARHFPHGELLPKVRAVVCSAGFGTTTRAVLAGIPPVVVPRGGDGRQVARAVSEAGVGIALDPDEASPQLLRQAVQRAFHDQELADRVRDMREGTSHDAAVTAADLVEALLEERLQRSGGLARRVDRGRLGAGQ